LFTDTDSKAKVQQQISRIQTYRNLLVEHAVRKFLAPCGGQTAPAGSNGQVTWDGWQKNKHANPTSRNFTHAIQHLSLRPSLKLNSPFLASIQLGESQITTGIQDQVKHWAL